MHEANILLAVLLPRQILETLASEASEGNLGRSQAVGKCNNQEWYSLAHVPRKSVTSCTVHLSWWSEKKGAQFEITIPRG